MVRYHSRKHIQRSPHTYCSKRPTVWNNPHHFRSICLLRLLLSLLLFKFCPNSGIGGLLTIHRYYSSQSPRSPSTQHFCTISLWRVNHLSPSQPKRRKSKAHTPSPVHHDFPRDIVTSSLEYYETSFTILDRVYRTTFFIATGFQGLHRIITPLFSLFASYVN